MAADAHRDPVTTVGTVAPSGPRETWAEAALAQAKDALARGRRVFAKADAVMQRVAIIDYGSGNLHSAAKAFERAARESEANAMITLTADPDDRRRRRPHRAAGRRRLRRLQARPRSRARHARRAGRHGARQGPAVSRHLRRHAAHGQPRPGVRRRPTGSTGSPARCAPSRPTIPTLKIPHMGWNTLKVDTPHALLRRHPDRPRRPARLFRALVSFRAGGPRATSSPRPTTAAR